MKNKTELTMKDKLYQSFIDDYLNDIFGDLSPIIKEIMEATGNIEVCVALLINRYEEPEYHKNEKFHSDKYYYFTPIEYNKFKDEVTVEYVRINKDTIIKKDEVEILIDSYSFPGEILEKGYNCIEDMIKDGWKKATVSKLSIKYTINYSFQTLTQIISSLRTGINPKFVEGDNIFD